jgi:hypothetical protein
MDIAEVADSEKLDQATNLLMASLQESRTLNLEIREALKLEPVAIKADCIRNDERSWRIRRE